MKNRTSYLAHIHIMKKELGVSDEIYKTILHDVCGVWSAKDITHATDFQAVIDALKQRGNVQSVYTSADTWGCSVKQRNKIVALWYEKARNKSMDALRMFIEHTAHVNHERFLMPIRASDVIVALEKL